DLGGRMARSSSHCPNPRSLDYARDDDQSIVCITAHNDTHEIAIHSITPRSNGRTPTAASDLRERPAPIRNSVSVRPYFASVTMTGHAGEATYVRTIDATRNQRMNQGIVIFAADLR